MAGLDFHRTGSRWRRTGWSLAGAALLVPLVAMAVTPEVNWGLEDFLGAALLLGGFGLALEVAMRVARSTVTRLVTAAVLVTALLVIWAELAVGLLS
jgi:hypothetical protein